MTMTETAPLDIRAKFDQLDAALNAELVERRQEIRSAVLALIGEQHIFFLGPHGIAKSMLARRLAGWIGGARCFPILLHRFMEPDELNGPLDFAELEMGRRVHLTAGYLPEAEVAFFDEIWEGGPALLKTLMWALNERKFRNGGKETDIPLSMAMCASNRLPELGDPTLAAMYDRVLIRHEVGRVKDKRNLKKMLRLELPSQDEPILTWTEVALAQEEARRVKIGGEVLEAIARLDHDLCKQEIEPSPRRLKDSLSVIRAAAWLDGCETATVDHMRVLQHILWDHPDQKGIVTPMVTKLASPLE